MSNDIVGEKQLAVLRIIHKLRGSAYGLSIQKSLSEEGLKTSLPQIYAILEKLVEKKLVTREWGEVTEERGDRPRREYCVTPDGTRVLSVAGSSVGKKATSGKWIRVSFMGG